MKQKFDITVITGGLGRDYVGTELKTKDHYISFWNCELSEFCAVPFDLNTTITVKLHKAKVLYGVEYDEDERKFKVFEHEEKLYSSVGKIVMNNYMTEEDAEELCWKYNQVGL